MFLYSKKVIFEAAKLQINLFFKKLFQSYFQSFDGVRIFWHNFDSIGVKLLFYLIGHQSVSMTDV